MKRYTIILTDPALGFGVLYVKSSGQLLKLIQDINDIKPMTKWMAESAIEHIEQYIDNYANSIDLRWKNLKMKVKISGKFKLMDFNPALFRTAEIREVEYTLK